MTELRRGDGDPVGVNEQKDTEDPVSLSHTLGRQESFAAPASRAEAEPVVTRLWLDPSYTVADIGLLLGRSRFFVHEIANSLGFVRPKPFSPRLWYARKHNCLPDAKARTIKRLNLLAEKEKTAAKEREKMIADLYARHGGYTDDPRALPPQPFMPIGWEPRPVDERLQRSMTGCSAAMAVRN